MNLDRFYLKGFTPALNFRETGVSTAVDLGPGVQLV